MTERSPGKEIKGRKEKKLDTALSVYVGARGGKEKPLTLRRKIIGIAPLYGCIG